VDDRCMLKKVAGTTLIVVGMATALELAPYGSLGRLPVGNLNVEPTRVFKELQT
jgi:hypothetical protein